MNALRKHLFAGLLVWLPLVVTAWVLIWLINLFDTLYLAILNTLLEVSPDHWRQYVDYISHIHGLGVVLAVVVLITTGALVSNVVGRWFLSRWNELLERIPIVKTIYKSVKKVSDTLFSSNGNAFRQALLVQYPRQGVWTIAFQTGTPVPSLRPHLPDDCISVYVPTTPNPTSGFFLIMPRSDVIELSMSVDEALTHVISMGAVAADASPTPLPKKEKAS
ncbi:MAG: DUF502 domain-containing protein [Betaproteobacteria bacterium]|nr:DUF502 domain-containing protein [Betaproteobacteria bacterium]NBP44209.1 DUF502 domain-containing protein [Betaproteobacteria bacterium]